MAVVILTVLGASLRFAAIGRQGFWIDEGYTAQLVHLSLGKMFGLIPQTESTPPLYYLIAWVWTHFFSDTEVGLRSLSALVGVAVVPVAYAAGRQLITPRAGVIAAALTACSPFLIWYSQEARAYELLVLLTSVSLLAFARARVAPTRKTLTVWAIVSVLALTTQYYAVLAVVPQAVWLLALYPRQRRIQVAAAAVGLCGFALVPLAISQAGTANAAWIGQLPLGLRLGQLIQFLVSFQAPVYVLVKWIAVATVVIGLLLLALRADFGERRGALVAGGLALGGLLLSLLMVTVGIDNLISRNLLALWVPAALLLAAGLGARRAGLVGPVAAAVLCATGIAVTLGVVADRKLERPDWRAVAHLIGATPAPNVRVRAIVIERWGERLPLSLYLPGLRFWPHNRAAGVTEVDTVAFAAPWVPGCWWGASCYLLGRGGLHPPPQHPSLTVPSGFHQLWRRRVFQFTITRLVSVVPITLTPRMLLRALAPNALHRDALLVQRRAG